MRYEVKAVSEHDLPTGTDWAFARVSEGTFLFVRESCFANADGLCRILSDAWAARIEVDSTRGCVHNWAGLTAPLAG